MKSLIVALLLCAAVLAAGTPAYALTGHGHSIGPAHFNPPPPPFGRTNQIVPKRPTHEIFTKTK